MEEKLQDNSIYWDNCDHSTTASSIRDSFCVLQVPLDTITHKIQDSIKYEDSPWPILRTLWEISTKDESTSEHMKLTSIYWDMDKESKEGIHKQLKENKVDRGMDNRVAVIMLTRDKLVESSSSSSSSSQGKWVDLKQIYGFISYLEDCDNSHAELTKIFIKEDKRREGFGTFTLDSTVKHLIRKVGIKSIYVTVPPTLHVMTFFLTYGFSFATQRPYVLNYTLTYELNVQMVDFINKNQFEKMKSHPRYDVFKSTKDGSYRMVYTGDILAHFDTIKGSEEEVKLKENDVDEDHSINPDVRAE